jgi:putative ATPase
MRPAALEDMVGQESITAPGTPLWLLCHPDASSPSAPASVILFGPPGTGKTTLAHVVAASGGHEFVELSAVTAGVKDVRAVFDRAQTARDLYGRRTVLFLDEIHRFSKAQQDSLLPAVEDGLVILIAATTENPSFSVITPLQSRSLVLRLQPLPEAALRTLLQRAVSDDRGLRGTVRLSDEAADQLVALAAGDARRALTLLEASAAIASAAVPFTPLDSPREKPEAATDPPAPAEAAAPDDQALPIITAEAVSTAADRALIAYDRNGDQHYDVISAFIKSVRGSDPDAALHYLARMIEGGEDPRFIARRLIVSASEDIGMADPNGLAVATAAAQAVQLIGMPEGRIPLAEATVYLATAPKSNASYLAIDAALGDVRAGRTGPVPPHLRDAHYRGAAALGHGVGYRYPHDAPHGVLTQQYLPDRNREARYYVPTQRGYEGRISPRIAQLRAIVHGEQAEAPAPDSPASDGGKPSSA